MAVSDNVLISLIGLAGGLGTAYIVNVVSKKVEANRMAKSPKDRIEMAFEWYDKAMKQRDEDNATLRLELKAALSRLEKSDQENSRLHTELNRIRSEYRKDKYKPQS